MTFRFLLVLFLPAFLLGQPTVPILKSLVDLAPQSPGRHHFWLEMGSNTFGQPLLIPVVLIEGAQSGPCLGFTAAIHGNELNGIPILHQLLEEIDPQQLQGRILAIPGLNAISIQLDERRFIDQEDLNRLFPGKEQGNRSQQYVHKIANRVVPAFDFLIDMHTASFGRTNTLYVRADLSNDTLAMLAKLQEADIILNNSGVPSAGKAATSLRTLRAEAVLQGIPCITVEYANPQVFQPEITKRGLKAARRSLHWLGMYALPPDSEEEQSLKAAVICKKSYWLFTDAGGFLEVAVELGQHLQKDDTIGILRDAFGQIIKTYKCPEAGIVIGKSSNPTNMSGGRIIHLGIFQ